MYLRRFNRRKNGKKRLYWALVESYRTEKGSRQRIVGYIGDVTKSQARRISQSAERCDSVQLKDGLQQHLKDRMGRLFDIDRGMVSEQNLTMLRRDGRRYIIGTPKANLKHVEKHLLEKSDRQVVHAGKAIISSGQTLPIGTPKTCGKHIST